MSEQHFDFVVIGGGSGGFAAARTARETCGRVAIIDGADELGGLCILRGCMPSKTLIYSAEVLHLAREGRLFGLNIPEATVDMTALRERKRIMVNEFREYRVEQMQSDRFTLFRDKATFTGENRLRLISSGREITADHFVVATGSVPQLPPIKGLAEAAAWTSDDVLELDFLPESVIVLGGGVVACELSQYLRRLGSRIIQIQRSPRILKEISPESATVIEEAFRAEGIELYTGTQLRSITRKPHGYEVAFTHTGETVTAKAAHLFNALGRRPAIDALGLAAARIETNPAGQIRVNTYQQTSNPRVYAAGDVCGPHEIVHLAIMQGEVAARHATGRVTDPVDYDTRTSVVFTDPQIAEAGIPLEEARARGMNLALAEYPFDDHGKSIVMEARRGFVSAWADNDTGRLVGAACVGKDGGELIHAMAVAISLRATPADLLKTHWYHPTLSEIWSYPLEDLAHALRS